MASSRSENRLAVSTTKLLAKMVIAVILCAGSAVYAQAQEAQPSSNESWTATAESSVQNTNPSWTMESHVKSGDRSVDKQRVEVLGPNGRYQPDYETDKETVQVNATTTRTVERTYRWDVNGQRNLVQVTEEEARSSANGDAQLVRTMSNSDANGNLQVMEREVADTKKTSPDAQETKTTVYLLDGNGRLTPSLQMEELQKRVADHRVEVKKTTLRPGSSGNWEVGEVKESTIKEDGKNRTTEERVSRPDLEGRLSEVSRTVDKETETAAGEKSNTVETYSTQVPGLAPDGGLHLNRRVTTVQKKDSGGEITEQQVEQSNSGNPNAGLQVSAKTKYVVKYAASGVQQTKTVEARDANGAFNVVSVETRKSDQAPAAQAQTAPPDKPDKPQ